MLPLLSWLIIETRGWGLELQEPKSRSTFFLPQYNQVMKTKERTNRGKLQMTCFKV